MAFSVTSAELFGPGSLRLILDFNKPVNAGTVSPADLLLNGSPIATAAVVADADTVEFALPSLESGSHLFAITSGAILDNQGTPLDTFSKSLAVSSTSQYVVKHNPRLQLGNAPLAGYTGSELDRVDILWQTIPATTGPSPGVGSSPPVVIDIPEGDIPSEFVLTPTVRTELITGGSTDDPIFWQNQENLDASRLVVTGKDGGAEVYNLDGARIQHFDVGQPNNGDVVYDSQGDIVAFSDREENQVVFYRVTAAGISETPLGAIDTGFTEVYGMGFASQPDKPYFDVIATNKVRNGVHWQVDKETLAATPVRNLTIETQAEGITIDVENNQFFLSEERGNIWRYSLDPSTGDQRTLIASGLTSDVEGLSIYKGKGLTGYLFASQQGSNNFLVYRRTAPFELIASFSVEGVTVTDGIDTTSLNLGGTFPLGGFSAQNNDKDAVIVDWRDFVAVGFAAYQTGGTAAASGDSFSVEYRLVGTSDWKAASLNTPISTGSAGRIVQSTTITGLAWDSNYEYRVRHRQADVIVGQYQSVFRTRLAAGDDKPFSFVAYGDSADGAALGFREVQARINQLDPEFAVLLGDNIYNSGTHKEADSRFDPSVNPEAAAWMAGHIDYLGLGNHDVGTSSGRPSEQLFSVPIPIEGVTAPASLPASERAEHNYSWDYGDVHFATIDTNSLNDPTQLDGQLKWLLRDLSASTARWKIVYGHHPVAGAPDKEENPGDDYYQQVVNQLQGAGVDLFMVGHSHTYSWTYPLTGQIDDEATYVDHGEHDYFHAGEGLLQLVSGVGGKDIRDGDYSQFPFVAVGFSEDTPVPARRGFSKIDVTRDTLAVSYIAADNGEVLGSFQLEKETTQTTRFQQGVGGYLGTRDTVLQQGAPNANNAANSSLEVDNDEPVGTGMGLQTLLRFDSLFGSGVGQIPLDATLRTAILRLNVTDRSADNMNVHRMLADWSDSDTWNSLAAGVQTNGVDALATPDTSSGTSQLGEFSFNVLSSLQAWQADPASNRGWVFVPKGKDRIGFDSSEGTTKPELIVTYLSATPTLSMTLSANSMSENGGSVAATVTRHGSDLSQPLTVQLSSSDTSEAIVPTTVTIAANVAAANFTISAVNDTLLDGTQSVQITATAVGFAAPTRTVTVIDHETLAVSIHPTSINENDGTATGTVTRSNTDTSAALIVDLASSDVTEATVPATVTILANQASANFTIAAINDTALDGTQTVTITASASGYFSGTRTVDVTDHEGLSLTISSTSIGENGGNLTATVTRSNSETAAPLTVNLASSDVSELTVPESVTLSANQISASFMISAIDDSLLDGTQIVTITASATGYINAVRTVNVTDHETLSLSINASSISEKGGTATATVTRSNTNNSSVLVVSLSSSDLGEATVPSIVLIPANQTTTTFTVAAVDDGFLDGTQTVGITASSAGYIGETRSVAVTDHETLTIAITPAFLVENGGAAAGTVTRGNSDISSALVVNLASNDPSEATVPATVTILANQSVANFTVTAVNDSLLDGTQTVTITASAGGYVDGTMSVEVADHESLSISTDSPFISENGGTAIGTVTRNNTDIDTALVVVLLSNDIGEAKVPATVTIPANQSSANFPITAVDDQLLDGTQTVTITGAAAGYISGTGPLGVTDYETLSVAIHPPSMTENGGTSIGTVTRSNTDIGVPLVVTLASLDTSEATVPAAVTIPGNQSTASFIITAVNDAQVDGTQAATITATAAGYLAGTQVIEVTDDFTLVVTFNVPSISENGGSAIGTVVRNSSDISSTLVVSLSSSDTTAATIPSSVTIPANQGLAYFTITAVDDSRLDGTQTTNITASATNYAGGSRTLSVTDFEALTISLSSDFLSENGGTTTATVTRGNTDRSAPLLVQLASSDAGEATVPATITIAANQASASFTVSGMDDTLLDGTQAVTLSATATGYINGTTTLNVTDHEILSVAISPSSMSENGGTSIGTVTRGNTDISTAVLVNLSSNDLSEATVPATVLILANQTAASFVIAAVDDSQLDGKQTSTINASAQGYVSGSRNVEVTDFETLTIVIGVPVMSEDGGTATATVTRGNSDNFTPLVVNLASNDASEATVPATVLIPANQASASFTITAVDDTQLDGTQSTTITASAAGFVDGTQSIDVTDQEILTVAITAASISENGGATTGTVTRGNSDISSELRVNLASSDYSEAIVPLTVVIAANQTAASFTITGADDNQLDGTQPATITASAAGYFTGIRTISVTDFEMLSVTINVAAISEHGGTAIGTIARGNIDASTALLVLLESSDSSEVTVPASVLIPANQAMATFMVTAVDDDRLDGTQVATITASAPGYVNGARNVDISDFETLTVAINPASIAENGGTATGTVTRGNSDNGTALVVNLASSDSGEATVANTVTIAPHQSSASFTITTVDDDLLDGTQSVTITGSAANYVSGTRIVNVTDHETLAIAIDSVSISENGESTTGTVTRNNTDTSAALLVNLAGNDASEASVVSTVVIPANQASAQFSINAVNDNLLDGTQIVTITGAAAGYVSSSRTLNVTDHELLSIAIQPSSISESGGTATGTVLRGNTDTASPLLVNLASDDASEATVPATVLIPANQFTATFPIAAVDDDRLDGTQLATITASAAGYVSATKGINVTDLESLTISIDAASVGENGATTTGTVTRGNSDTSSELVVNLTSNDTTEATVPTTVTIAAHQASASFTITAVDDNLLDGIQKVTFTGSAVGYVSGSSTLDVTDHEGLAVTAFPAVISENGGTTTGTVTRSNTNIAAPLVVRLSSDDTSEATVPLSVIIPSNQTSASFTITAVNDEQLDGTQPVTIRASADRYIDGIQTVAVTDDGTLFISVDVESISENGGIAFGTVIRDQFEIGSELIVHLKSDDVSEATVPASVTIPANELQASFVITAVDDNLLDGDKLASISATADRHVPATQSVRVTDHESLSVTVNPVALSEHGGIAIATVTRNNLDRGQVVTVTLTSSDSGELIVPTTVFISPNQPSATFVVRSADDTLLDGTQSARITATASGYAAGSALVDVTDHETLTLIFDSASASESGGFVTGTVTRNNTNLDAPLVVELAGSKPSEVDVPVSVTIAAHQSSANFTVTAIDDDLLDGRQVTEITASAPGYLSGIKSLEIADYEELTITVDRTSLNEHGGMATGTVTRGNSDNAGPLIVNLASNDASEATVPAAVIIPAGQASAIFSITAADDSLLDGTQSVNITGSALGYVSAIAPLEITDFETLAVAVSPKSIRENAGTAIGTVVRSNTNISTSLLVRLSSSSPGQATVPTTVVIPVNQTVASFAITPVDDDQLDGTQIVTISASSNGYIAISDVLELLDHETLTVTLDATSISEGGGQATGSVTRNNFNLEESLVVDLATSDPTAATVPASVTIAANQTSASFTVTAVDDNRLDGIQSITITANGAGYATSFATLDVTDLERAPLITSSDRIEVAENQVAIATIEAVDADPPPHLLRFSIVGGADRARFTLHALTGELLLLTPPDFESPNDVGSDHVYELEIEVRDATDLIGTQLLSVEVTAVNDQLPRFVSLNNVVIDENTTNVVRPAAIDGDLPEQTVTFTIRGGADADRFLFDASTQLLTFLEPPDFEAPGDANRDNQYEVQLEALDSGGGRTTQDLKVAVRSVNEPPMLSALQNLIVVEGTPIQLSLAGSEPDGDPLSYSLISGFQPGMGLSAQSGAFQWTPTEIQDGVHILVFQARDPRGLVSADQSVTIQVDEVNTPPTLENPGDRSFDERTEVAFSLSAEDRDVLRGVAELVHFTILSGGLPGMNFKDSTGEFRWTPGESQDGSHSITFQAIDSRGAPGNPQTILLTVRDRNTAPTLSIPQPIVSEEASPISFTLVASDFDVTAGVADTVVFTLVGAELPGMSLNPATGEFHWLPSEMQDGAFQLVFQALDAHNQKSDEKTLSVSVVERNESPVLEFPTHQVVAESQPLLVALAATDPDWIQEAPDTIQYLVHTGLLPGMTLDRDTGQFRWTPSATQTGEHFVVFQAIDGTGQGSIPVSMTIEVRESNQPPTAIELLSSTVNENVAGAIVGRLQVSDPDPGQTHTFTVGDSRFEVVDQQLRLRASSRLDFETEPFVSLAVTAHDPRTPTQTVTQTFTIAVRDVNDPPAELILSNPSALENLSGLAIGTLTVQDSDAGQSHTFTVTDLRFEVVGRELRLKRDQSLHREEDGAQLTIEITVRDGGTPSLTLTRDIVLNVFSNPRPWQNPIRHSDATNDGRIVPLDALNVINLIGNPSWLGVGGKLPRSRPADSQLPYYDVNGDGFCTTNDALQIINSLNSSTGEGEASIDIFNGILPTVIAPAPGPFAIVCPATTAPGTPPVASSTGREASPATRPLAPASIIPAFESLAADDAEDERWNELESLVEQLASDICRASVAGR